MHLQTDRLLIRTLEAADAETLFSIVHQPGITRYMRDWPEQLETPDHCRRFIAWMGEKIDLGDLRDNKRYGVILQETGEFIGMVGMGEEERLGEIEVAYFLSNAHTGNGYAAEALSALLAWIFQKFELPYLVAMIHPDNMPSQRLALRCGFRLWEERVTVGYQLDVMRGNRYLYYRYYRP